MDRKDALDFRVERLIDEVSREFADMGDELRWQLTRSLIHKAVHFATERSAQAGAQRAQQGPVDYCALATYLAEMIGHAHQLAHGNNPGGHPQAHRDKDLVH